MSWTKQTPPASTWVGDAADALSWASGALFGFLLMEDGGYLLQETGGKIRLNQLSDPDWDDTSNSGSWTKATPHTGVWT